MLSVPLRDTVKPSLVTAGDRHCAKQESWFFFHAPGKVEGTVGGA